MKQTTNTDAGKIITPTSFQPQVLVLLIIQQTTHMEVVWTSYVSSIFFKELFTFPAP